ncbi:MAG: FlgD immunoglobulin-like domain containing protein [Candidatus Zixiibacteriota bacterium]
MKRIGLGFLILFTLLILDGWSKGLTPGDDVDRFKLESASNSVEPQLRVHRRGNINFSITNWGFLGSQMRDLYESPGCLFCDHPDREVHAPSFEFPSNSDLEYLFQGALWVGGVVEGETLVTVGADGWFWIYELWPSSNIKEREWLADQECITAFADTFIRPKGNIPIDPPDYWEGRPHKPLNVDIIQHSYSWQSSSFDNFIILDYTIRNIGDKLISDVYLGFYLDTDIDLFAERPYDGPYYGFTDDLTGYLETWELFPDETVKVNIAWAADNNGEPYSGEFKPVSPTSVIGIKLLGSSNPDARISYNWWISNTIGYPKDWGPWLKVNQEKWEQINPYGSGIYFPDNAMGTPGGDRSKYFLMSNGEIDFDQIFTDTLPKIDTSWVSADSEYSKRYFVVGEDIKFVYSFGPFDLPPGDSIFAVVALVAGEDFHTFPENRTKNLPENPYTYYENLDFSDLVNNAQKALEVYESGYTLPPPGPPENFTAFTMKGNTVRLIWTHKNHPNLKGYNIYRSISSDDPTPKKINSEIITIRLYIDEGLIEGEYYNYWIASMNQNNLEGKRSSIKVLAGRPRVPSGLKAESSKDQVRLSWYPGGERDLVGYKIYRTDYDSLQLVDSVGLVTNYVDRSVINGVIYYYKITAVDSLGLESFLSDSAYALTMAFDRGIGIFDRTRPYYYSKFEPQDFGCSVDSMYKRIFQEITTPWIYLTHDDRKTNWDISLQDLSPYPVILIHSENLQGNQDWGSEHSMAFIIRHYLRAGGKLIFEGTNNNVFFFWDAEVRTDSPEAEFCDPGYIKRHDSLFCEYLFLDKAYFPLWTSKNRTEEFVGAFSKATEYPHLEVDSERVDRWSYSGSLQFPVQGKLPGIGYLIPKDTSVYPVEVIYTFNSAYDTSDLEGKPVAIRYLGDDYKFVFFNFPLYYIQEEQAIQVLHQALRDLGVIPTAVPQEPVEELSVVSFSLKQNYPNPFNLTTTIPFTVHGKRKTENSPIHTTLSIYNILGQKVRTLVDEKKLPGEYKVNWDGKDEKGNEVGSGIYLYRLKAEDYEQVKKMVLLK